jgi:phosphotriesterase-related protein
MATLITTLGPKEADQFGMILPHEHVFVDLRTWDQPGYAQADPQDVIRLMTPELDRARASGITAICETTPIGVGRRIDILRAVSEATQFPLVVPTGIYREPWVPPWAHQASEDELYEWMQRELNEQVEQTGVKAAWIKLSAGDDGLTPTETKILRAAARAAKEVNALIGSHTIRGRVVQDQLREIEAVGYTPERYLWIHTQMEPDLSLHVEIARRGAWIEFDALGSPDYTDQFFIERIQRVLDAGVGDHLLLSHDRGWYDPGKPGGGTPLPYTYLPEVFVPKLREAGLDEATITRITHHNPYRAFAR